MNTYAMFVKIDGQWRYEGMTENEENVAAFARSTLTEIRSTKNSEVRTEAYMVFTLE